MNRIKKGITVRFFSIESDANYLDDFISIYHANQKNEKSVRIINNREKKLLIKIHEELSHKEENIFFLTVVRERNTWQTKALANGKISGIPLNQGIIGDPYYFLVVPKHRIILGFTTGLSDSLKSVGNITLQQFNKNRTSKINLEPVFRKRELSKLKELSGYNKLHFKVNANTLEEPNEETPNLLKQLGAAPFMANNLDIALTFSDIGNNGFSESELVDIVSNLSENDGCSVLTVQGTDSEGSKVNLDFSKVYSIFKTEIEIRNKYIDEGKAQEILLNAFSSFDPSTLTNS